MSTRILSLIITLATLGILISLPKLSQAKAQKLAYLNTYCAQIDSGQFPDYRGSFESGCASSYSNEE